jgi:hypothetical protein
MSDEASLPIPWYRSPFLEKVAAGVTGGVILLVIGGIANDLSTTGILVIVGVGVLIVLLVALVVGIRRYRTRLQARAAWEQAVGAAVVEQRNAIRRIILHDVIHTARVCDWEVGEDEEDDLAFISKEGHEVYVTDDYPNRYEVAESLHNAAPDHFPADWKDFLYDAYKDAALAQRAVEDLGQRVEHLEDEVRQGLMRATLGTTAAEAEATYGWTVHWLDDRVIFEKEKGSQVLQCTVPYDDDVDIAKLRKRLGLTLMGHKY